MDDGVLVSQGVVMISSLPVVDGPTMYLGNPHEDALGDDLSRLRQDAEALTGVRRLRLGSPQPEIVESRMPRGNASQGPPASRMPQVRCAPFNRPEHP